jgi:DNA-binding MarR family transcriptional regulator
MGSHTSPSAAGAANDKQRALDSLRRIVQALRISAGQAQHATGLSGAQLFVLQQLSHEPLSINQLAERTYTHQSSVSMVVQRLEAEGLLDRRTTESDGRKVLAHLLPLGRAVLRRAPSIAQDELLRALDGLSPNLRSGLARGLEQLADGMGLAPAPPMFFEERSSSRFDKKSGSAKHTSESKRASVSKRASRSRRA